MVVVRRHLHAYPEPSGQEWQTTGYIAERLRRAGLEVRLGPQKRGLIVDPPPEDQPAPASAPVPRIAFRADLDALRIQDAKQTSYRSRVPQVMHACGHDGHTAVVCGAVLGLETAARKGYLPWPVRWRAIFQPAEETAQGALEMIAAGAMDEVEAILSLHMDPSRPVGCVGLRPEVLTAYCDVMEIRLQGRGGHGARPHESLDPIAAAAQLISTIYLFLPRAVNAQDPVVVSVGQIWGGENPNVIPDQVTLRGTVRSSGGEVRNRTLAHIQQLARGIAEVSGTQIDVLFGKGTPSVYNDPELTELFRRCALELLGPEPVQTISRPSMGGEDFAHYLDHAPGSMLRLGCGSANLESPPLHSAEFDLEEPAMAIGAKLLARTAVLWSNPARHKLPGPRSGT
jgi:amidohydrolase